MTAESAELAANRPTDEGERPGTERLRGGTLVRLRPVQPRDLPRVTEFLARVSRDSLEQRYFRAITPEAAAAEIVAPRAGSEGVSLVLEVAAPDGGPIVAHGEYDRETGAPTRAEIAFLVRDDWQGQGAATRLLLRLAELAAAAGVRQLEAVVRAENRPMIDVFLGSGYPCSIDWHDGEGFVRLDIGREPAPSGLPWGTARDAPLVPA